MMMMMMIFWWRKKLTIKTKQLMTEDLLNITGASLFTKSSFVIVVNVCWFVS